MHTSLTALATQEVRWFWEIVHALPADDQRRLLQFATGTNRAPVNGLKSVPFCVQRSGPDSDRLPAAHTCFNILDLPAYASKEKMQAKLTTALAYSEGFGFE